MITLKLKVGRATAKGPQDPGEVITVPDEEGRRMIEKGQAKEVKSKVDAAAEETPASEPETEVETASSEAAENASKAKPVKRTK